MGKVMMVGFIEVEIVDDLGQFSPYSSIDPARY
jgi:hypothetical protein